MPDKDQPKDGEEPRFHVTDRRWWAREEEPGALVPEGAAERKPTYVEELEARAKRSEERLAEVMARHREALDGLERSRARIEREAQKDVERSRREFLASFLDVMDNLDRALQAAEGHQGDFLLEGVRLVRQTFLAKLREHGVTPQEAAGRRFDPRLHEAVSVTPVDEPDLDGRILAIIRPGYVLGDEPLRPAWVAVGRYQGTAA